MVDFDDDVAPSPAPDADGDNDGDQTDPILDNAKKLRAAGASIDQIKQYLTSKGYSFNGPTAPQAPPQQNISTFAQRHPNYAQQAAAENAADQAAAKPNMFRTLATHALNTAQGIPGMRAFEAGAGALGSQLTNNPMNYTQSLGTLDAATNTIPRGMRVAEQFAGSLPLLGALPANPAVAGALLGGANEALSADPESLKARALKTAGGAAIGGAVGKVSDAVMSGLGGLVARNPSVVLLEKQADRALSAKNLYDAAMKQGNQNGTLTQPIVDFLSDPDIAPIVQNLKSMRQFQNTPEESPEMLDAVYKVLSDHAQQLKKGLESVSPNKPNLGRFNLQDVNQAKGAALEAMSGTPQSPGPMPSYAAAVKDYADRTAEINAMKRGYGAYRSSLSGNLPAPNNLTRTTPQALGEWASTTASPAEIAAARQGVMGAAGMAQHVTPNLFTGFGILPSLYRSAGAGELMRNLPGGGQPYIDALQKLGLLGLNAQGNDVGKPSP